MKKVNIVLIVLLIVSIGINVYQYNQLKGIKDELQKIETEKGLLEETVKEKDKKIETDKVIIEELTVTVEEMQIDLEVLKEQLTSIEVEKMELEKQKEALETEQSSTVGGAGNANTSTGGTVNSDSEGETGTMSRDAAASKFNLTNFGSGGGQPVTGSDSGWILE